MRFILMLLAVALTVNSVRADDLKTTFEKEYQLVDIRKNIDDIQALKDRGLDVDANNAVVNEQLDIASKVAGKKLDLVMLYDMTGGAEPPPTTMEQVAGFITFGNVLLVIAGIVMVVAAIALFGNYFYALICAIPLPIWEVICYGICFGLIRYGASLSPDMYLLTVLPGSFGLVACTFLTKFTHFSIKSGNSRNYRGHLSLETWEIQAQSWFLAIAWGLTAVYFDSSILGFMSVFAVFSALGFGIGVVPGVVYVGFEEESVIPRATLAGFLILAFHVMTHIIGLNNSYIEPFMGGAEFIGSFVYFLGILIMSWKYYWNNANSSKYLPMQIICLVSGIAALYIGNTFGLGALTGVGGTLFFLWLCEKYTELPWEGVGCIWATLLGSILIYVAVGYMKMYPEYFLLF